VKADVSNKTDVEKLAAAAIKKFKKVDILVNNAGIVRHAPILEMSEEDWDTVIDVDLKGVFLCSQAFARHMVQRKHGRIINISSIAGIGGSKRVSVNYAAAKAGVIALSKRFARELGKYGITVNAIAPGFIMTDIGRTGKTQEQYKAHVRYCKKATVLDKVGQVEDIAATAAFLASDEAAFISGTVISVDGGRTDKL
jgi:3-oxoacyl-[acyl-carrier protein] reductase